MNGSPASPQPTLAAVTSTTVSPSGLTAAGTVAPGQSASATFTVTAPTSGLSPGFDGFDGIGTTYSAQGLAVDGLTPGASVQASNTQVAAVNYANYPTGSSGHTVYIFEQSVPLAAGKTVEAVTLPSLGSVSGYNPALHVFAMAVG